MKRSIVIRVDEDFFNMLEEGRKACSELRHKEISMTDYTAQMATILKPMSNTFKTALLICGG